LGVILFSESLQCEDQGHSLC